MSQSFVVRCPGCSKKLRFQDQKLLGRQIRCPQCQHAFTIPGAAGTAAVSEPSPLSSAEPDDGGIPDDDLFGAEATDFESVAADDDGFGDFGSLPAELPPPRPRKKRSSSNSVQGGAGKSKQRKAAHRPSRMRWILPAAIAGGVLAIGVIGLLAWLVWPGGDSESSVAESDPAPAETVVTAAGRQNTSTTPPAPSRPNSAVPQVIPEVPRATLQVSPPDEATLAARRLEGLGAQLQRNVDGQVVSVELSRSSAKDVELSPLLSALPALEVLKLVRCDNLTYAVLQAVADCNTLRSVELDRCKGITPGDVSCLKGLPHLEELIIGGLERGNSNFLKYVGELTTLKTLDLAGSPFVRDDGLQHLTGLTELETLNLSRTRLEEGEFEPLTALTRLRTLYLPGGVTDGDMESICELKELRRLSLAGCGKVSDDSMDLIDDLPWLQVLDLEFCTRITDHGLFRLQFCPELREVNLDYCMEITDRGLGFLQKAEKLELVILPSEFVREPQHLLVQENYTPEGVEALRQTLPRCRVALTNTEKSELRDTVRTYPEPEPVATADEENAEAPMTERNMDAPSAGDAPVEPVKIEFVRISAGTFQMGSERAGPPHQVTLTQDFEMSVTEVTQTQWQAVMHTQPWKTDLDLGEFGLSGVDVAEVGGAEAVMAQLNIMEGPNYPASNMTWEEAVRFCERLSEYEGVKHRLPTSAEWEYACRAGTTTMYSFGDDDTQINEYAWHSVRPRTSDVKYAHEVATKLPNPWGLYDMHGNLSEWCLDGYRSYDSAPVVDPIGPTERRGEAVTDRIVRGGNFKTSPASCRSSAGSVRSMDSRSTTQGFRVVRVPADVGA